MSARLLASHLAVCGVGFMVLLVTVRLTAPSFFDHHIGNMAGIHGPGGSSMADQGAQLDDALNRSLNEGFLLALAVALPLSVVVSLLVSRQLSSSTRRLAEASRGIARGEYGGRVPTSGPPEIADLASSFNAMAVALEGAERRRMELIADVAHELRTPVTVLSGYAEGLSDGVFPPSQETWDKLAQEAGRLSRLVEELQELSRAEAGQFTPEITAVDLVAAVAATAARLQVGFDRKGLVLEVDAPSGLPLASADFDRVVQILTNLLANALKYTATPGKVVVSARREGEAIEIAVADSGAGVSPEDLPHLFERFYRVDRSRARISGGSGLGLTIAKAMAEAMGGTLRAQSAGLGQGSTFTLALPRSS